MLRFIYFAVLSVAFAASGYADERMGSFVIYDDVPDAIVLDGEIGINSPLDFRRAMAARPKARMVLLNSPGGLVASALLIADDINRTGLSTAIPKDAGCYSACSFIFFAGTPRYADGKLGVHQMASEVPDPSGLQTTMSDILEALNKYHVPFEVITRMLRTHSDDMYVFSPTEIAALGIESLSTEPAVPEGKSLQSPEPSTPNGPGAGPQLGPRLAIYGADFYGHDLAKSRVAEFSTCAKACVNDGRCIAFTFNANPAVRNGPNCFLKDGIGEVQAYSQALSGVFLLPNTANPSWEIDAIDPLTDISEETVIPNQNLSGSPLQAVSTQSQCLKACVANDQCAGFSFAYKAKVCFLKRTAVGLTHQSLVNSGIKHHLSITPLSVVDLSGNPSGSR